MKFNSCFLFGALSAVNVAVIGWSVWSTQAVAQEVVSPVAPPPVLPASYPAGSELKPAQSNRAPQLQPPQFAPYTTPAQPPAQVAPGEPIGLPGPPVYHDPNRSGVVLPLQAGRYSIQVHETDGDAGKRIIAYQELQDDINKLLQRRHDPNSESQWAELRQQIVEATAKQFDLRQQLREREIEQLKQRLAEVESTVENRNKLKDEIVEKRVAEILREPDQLQWEPLGISPPPNGPAMLLPSYGSTPAPPAQTYVPRTVTRIHRETTVDEKGNKQTVDRPIQETVYGEVEPVRIVPIPDDSTSTPLASARESAIAFLSQQQLAPTTLSVAEARARVRIAESKRDNMIRRGYKGDVDAAMEVKTLTAELELAKVMLAQAEAEYEGRTKLLELEVRRQESALGLASAVLAETQEINKRSPKTIPPTQVVAQEAAVEQARIELDRAKTLLEVHQKSNATQENLPGAEPNDK
jgi:hypothetical protein